MDRPRRVEDQEIVDQRSVAHRRLGADPRRVRLQVVDVQRRAIALAGLEVALAKHRIRHLSQPRRQILGQRAPETGEGRQRCHVARIERRLAVSLPRQRQYGVRPDSNIAADHAREVNAEKGQFRIGHRIDQVLDDRVVARREARCCHVNWATVACLTVWA